MISDKPIFKPELAEKVKQAKRIELNMATEAIKLKQLKEEIKKEMGTQDYVFDEFGVIIAEWNRFQKSSFNQTKFKKDYPEIASLYITMVEQRNFYLK